MQIVSQTNYAIFSAFAQSHDDSPAPSVRKICSSWFQAGCAVKAQDHPEAKMASEKLDDHCANAHDAFILCSPLCCGSRAR